ncbi:MAG TPA: hypothetical protein PKA77_17715 [Chitinophagaceae bacterium]|jgi:hypothetical protein|nr:hypothetical protein [Chitinophagaceae bacterium]HMU60028.1 hypothetical protein [Chitinophagaceae bacterium]
MATDGVKIIDGDLAHDTYWGIMDLYDSNVDIATIKNEIPFVRTEYGMEEDFYHEIFVTSYALAFWEIGELTDEILQEVKSVIKVGAGVKVWTEQTDAKEGKARQKELEKLLKKISQPNTKIRARKKYRKITNFHFQVDDLLTFKLKDNCYRAVICSSIDQYRGECTYMLTLTTYKSKMKPTVEDLFNYDISGVTIGAGYDRETIIQMQPGVENLWTLYPYYGEFFFGLVQQGVLHEWFVTFKNKFEKVGTLRIKDSFKKSGSHGAARNFERFEDILEDYDKQQRIFGYKKFPVKLLCER